MKNVKLAPSLLVAYCIYSGFVPTSIAHSLIIMSLAALCGYQIHISRQETTKYNKEVLDSLKNEVEAKIVSIKELHEKKLLKMEDEVSKLNLSMVPPRASSSSSTPQPRKVVF